jgi:hypothetical protein
MFKKNFDDEASTRLKIVKYLLISVLIVVLAVLMLSAFGIAIPEFVSGIVIMGYMTMLKDAVTSYFKSREDIQVARVETAKIEAAKVPCISEVK